jgi:hypothetical protein
MDADPDEVLIETQKAAEPHLRIHAIWRMNEPTWWQDVPSNTDIFLSSEPASTAAHPLRGWPSTAQALWRG